MIHSLPVEGALLKRSSSLQPESCEMEDTVRMGAEGWWQVLRGRDLTRHVHLFVIYAFCIRRDVMVW
jgi:hypothetical protein